MPDLRRWIMGTTPSQRVWPDPNIVGRRRMVRTRYVYEGKGQPLPFDGDLGIVGGSRMTWAATIVVILLWIAIAIWIGVLLGSYFETSVPPSEASAGMLVGASCFSSERIA